MFDYDHQKDDTEMLIAMSTYRINVSAHLKELEDKNAALIRRVDELKDVIELLEDERDALRAAMEVD